MALIDRSPGLSPTHKPSHSSSHRNSGVMQWAIRVESQWRRPRPICTVLPLNPSAVYYRYAIMYVNRNAKTTPDERFEMQE
jgi:hypothetical protein